MADNIVSSKDIRKQFIDFFITKNHQFVHSSPVIPTDDKTLLFANAGMNQFKSIFLGQREISYPRAVNSQKCIRAGGKHNDLEEVGKDGYHHTFFEMLGNWSFGDYYKEEAIVWAWELLTEVWKLPKELLYATVHTSDHEAYELWKAKTDIIHEHISYHGDKDNFWEMGETGPCGPCSEIHIDRGAAACDKQGLPGHVCSVNGDCARFIELWNLVFIQYNREESRDLTPLKHKFVDTGAGLERITQVLQNKHSNYETDLFMPIILHLAEISKVPYTQETGTSHRVIADHIRCLCFALADGGFPSNEGRGYVLRRILRRAARHGRLLGFKEPFLYRLVDSVVEVMGHHFTELQGKEDYLRMVIKAEEERFNRTLDTGLEIFTQLSQNAEQGTIKGSDVFMLYDTFGFPLDLTMLLAEEQGLRIDIEGFEAEMEQQRNRARSANKFAAVNEDMLWLEFKPITPTSFTGYTDTSLDTVIQRYCVTGDAQVVIQLERSPFYAESGGQIADTGIICNDDFTVQVQDVKKRDEYILHYGILKSGVISDKPVKAEIDLAHRKSIARNHTATHLLHKALRTVLGSHVQQKGSLVHSDYLRFDFTHFQALTPEEIKLVEDMVNTAILNNLPLNTKVQDIESAKQEGAMALFGEKYSDEVRVVNIVDYSKELCGGTHVQATGEIGLFVITSESSSAAGIRRIEALTGSHAKAHFDSLYNSIVRIAEKLHTNPSNIESKLEALINLGKELENQIKELQTKSLTRYLDDVLQTPLALGDASLYIKESQLTSEELKLSADILKSRLRSGVALLLNVHEQKLNILCVVSSDITSRYQAGKIVSHIASLLGGKGGGRPDSAMAGGKDLDALPAILQKLPSIIASL